MCTCPPEQPCGHCRPAAGAALTVLAEDVVRQHRARLLRVARHEGLLPEDALDGAQDALITFLSRPDAARLAANPTEAAAMLTTLVRNHARNRRRRHHNARVHTPELLEELTANTPDAEGALLQAEERVRLKACVAGLGELQRRVVTLRMLEERPGEDVAQLLGVSANHVAVLLLRAKAALRVCMLPAGEGISGAP